jgi:D-alanyl-D-alanine carboxypeptidase
MFTVIYFLIFSLIFTLYTFSNMTIGEIYFSPGERGNYQILTKPENLGEDFNEPITAESVLIVDKTTKNILWQKNADLERPIASITKLMTALVFLETNPDWQKVIGLQLADFRQGGSFYLRRDEKLSINDLFHLSLINSDNVATLAIVRLTGLSQEEFVNLMNQKARLLGMENTFFTDPTGVNIENVSTAYDVSKLVIEAFTNSFISEVTSLNNYQIIVNEKEDRLIKNTNKLLNSQEIKVLRGKTGYLEEAGYCLVSEVENSNQKSVYIILLGSQEEDDRFIETKSLASWINESYIIYN